MSSEFWDEKYSTDEYRYGMRPNAFVAEHALDSFDPESRVLCLGAGEGRNAVWLAEQGYSVTAVEQSSVGIDKMLDLAAEREVQVDVIHAGLEQFEPEQEGYGGVVMTYLHLAPELRTTVHERAVDALAPGGVLLMEAFRSEQIDRESGGPPDPELLYTEEMIAEDFTALEIERLEALTSELDEGHGHSGPAEILRFIGRKPASK